MNWRAYEYQGRGYCGTCQLWCCRFPRSFTGLQHAMDQHDAYLMFDESMIGWSFPGRRIAQRQAKCFFSQGIR